MYCPYCFLNHLASQHRCKRCKELGHGERSHQCEYCLENHPTKRHVCTFPNCGTKGHGMEYHSFGYCTNPDGTIRYLYCMYCSGDHTTDKHYKQG